MWQLILVSFLLFFLTVVYASLEHISFCLLSPGTGQLNKRFLHTFSVPRVKGGRRGYGDLNKINERVIQFGYNNKDLLYLFLIGYFEYVTDIHQKHRLFYSKVPLHRHSDRNTQISCAPQLPPQFQNIWSRL